jgi:TonB family protein
MQTLERPSIAAPRPDIRQIPPARAIAIGLSHPWERLSRKAQWTSWGVSAALHTLFLFGLGSVGIMKTAEFGMSDAGRYIEVDMVAAPAAPAASRPRTIPEPAEPVAAKPAEDAIPMAQTPEPEPAAPSMSGDGSSAIPGTDATTQTASAQGATAAKPGYYLNPPPPYPREAKRLKQEGRVLLEAVVDPRGRIVRLRIKESSGFDLLDEAAEKAVTRWRFRPARLAGVPIESVVEVPIRFELT